MIIATLGLLKNSGLEVSHELQQIVNTFTTSNISGSVQRVVPTATPEILEVLQSAPVCFTGFLPSGVTAPSGAVLTNIPKSVLDQAYALFKPVTQNSSTISVATFISVYTLASAYCSQAVGLQSSISAAQGKTFSDLGVQFQNYTDIITGGVSSQFNVDAVPALAAELPNLGTMFDTTVLSNISDLGTLVTHLYNLGLGDVGNLRAMVEENGITLDYIDDSEKTLLTNIFKKITGEDLATIVKTTSFKPVYLDNINSLADVLDINKLFSNEALAAIGKNPTLNALANKLSNIGGRFKSMSDIGAFLSGLKLNTFPALNELSSLLPSELTTGLASATGKGSGVFGNPLITDLVGSASGTGYTARITSMVDTQTSLLGFDVDVINFKNYLDNTSTLDAVALQNLIDKINSKSSLVNILQNANQQMIDCAEQLNIEKNNLQLAGINPGSIEADKTGIQNFVSNLNKLSADPDGITLGNFLASMTTKDVYGDAIKASIAEGQNLSRMAAYGINVGTKLG